MCAIPFVEANTGALKTDIFWRRDLCPLVLRATVSCDPAVPEDQLRLADFPGRKTILLTPDGLQHVLIRHKGHTVQLICEGEEVQHPHAVLEIRTRGFKHGNLAILAYQRLRSLRQSYQLVRSLFKPAPRAWHLRNALMALDCDRQHLSRRQTAIRLYGEQVVAEQWDDADGGLRVRVLNAVRRGRALAASEYRQLLA